MLLYVTTLFLSVLTVKPVAQIVNIAVLWYCSNASIGPVIGKSIIICLYSNEFKAFFVRISKSQMPDENIDMLVNEVQAKTRSNSYILFTMLF